VSALYSLAEVRDAVGGVLENADPGAAVSGISIDSREARAGDLFVAIAGGRFDGHDFAAQAVAAGAGAALVSQGRRDALPPSLPLVVVEDAFDGLRRLARFARDRSQARIVAVTGSAGKTSTKEALRAILAEAGSTHASVKSFNNHWGVPLTLARMPAESAFGVFEIGMNHAGEITPLTRLVRPHVALITSIGEAHLEFFEDVADIADAKAEIFAGLEPGGRAIINADHDHLDRLVAAARSAGAEIVTYGVSERAAYRIHVETCGPGMSGRLVGPDFDLGIAVPSPGVHTLVNAAGALLAARACGIAPEKAAAVLAQHRAGAGRGEMLALGPGDEPLLLIDESYNANPSSMRAALSVFATLSARRHKVLVLGDMRELGDSSPALHAGLAEAVRTSGADRVYLVGEHMAHLAAALPEGLVQRLCSTTKEIAPAVLDALAYGDAVMVKGSNGVGLASLVDSIKAHFAQDMRR